MRGSSPTDEAALKWTAPDLSEGSFIGVLRGRGPVAGAAAVARDSAPRIRLGGDSPGARGAADD